MKGLLGFKNKASTLVKDRLEQARTKGPESESALQKPFEDAENSGRNEVEAHSSGLTGREDGRRSRSRSASPNRPPQPSQGKAEVDSVLEYILHKARRDAVKEEFLKITPEEYTASHSLKIRAGTYNVNGRKPPDGLDLSSWLDVAAAGTDVVAVGFQEIVPLNAQNVVIGASLEAAISWEELIDAALNGPSERESGHLVIRSQNVSSEHRDRRKSFDTGKSEAVKLGSRANSSALELPEPKLSSLQTETEGSALTRHDSDGTQNTDDLEGYLSPAEDTASIFSDDTSGPKPYVQIVGKQMVGIYLTVWVRRALLRSIRGVQTTSVGTGVMGYLGNKGAVAARLRIFDSGIVFIVSHLSSGEQDGDEQKRNYDYSEIVRRGSFPAEAQLTDPDSLGQGVNGPDLGPEIKVASIVKSGQWGNSRGLLEIENVIWMGDLNYRLKLEDVEARKAIKANLLDKLVEHDELTIARREQGAFQGWQEGPLTFPPTFKFKRGTTVYLGDSEAEQEPSPELSSSSQAGQNASNQKQEGEKRRTPAWTDRVLWRSKGALQQQSYTSANLTASDHRPVAATFAFTAREYTRSKVETVMEAARRTVDAREMAAMPRCELEPLTVEVGIVTYAKERLAHLILTNTGAVPAKWQFMSLPGVMFGDREDEVKRPAPKWAKVQPEKGSLEPGQAVEITLTIWIDGGQQGTAELLTSTLGNKLDAILVLRVEEGNDVFCSISGSYSPSFFGLTPSLLSSLPRYVEVTRSQQSLGVFQNNLYSLSRPLSNANGWETGSPKLRIRTDKSARQRQVSDGPPIDFYSPLASFHSSPRTENGEVLEEKNESRHERQGEITAAINQQAEPSGVNSSLASAPHLGASDVDQMFAAFGTASLAESADSREQAGVQQATVFASRDSSAPQLLPPEVEAMTAFLKDKGRLTTPGLFLSSRELANSLNPRSPANYATSKQIREDARALVKIRVSLDRGQGIPSSSSAQAVAAVLLAYFCSIPHVLITGDIMEAVGSQQNWSKDAVHRCLEEKLQAADFALLQHVLVFLRMLMRPVNVEANGLQLTAVASLFSEVWFDRKPPHMKHRLEGSPVQKSEINLSQDVDRQSHLLAVLLS